MKKQTWEEPQILVQKFMPNEYIAACGDSGKVYNFECNAGTKDHNYYVHNGSSYQTIDGYYYGPGSYTFTPCKKTHQASTDSEFITGLFLDDASTRKIERIPVVVWIDANDDYNIHCTEKLNMTEWTTAKS